ncbi:MAG: alanine--tRNA ligase [Clostridia bacterium]|nr:alanine--tRNA ligase [Clostridia bacterium]
MKWTGVNELREAYLSFFESKGHLRHKSFPLVPQNDKSVLLINAGMTPLKKYFTGELEPPCHRMTTCQKCIRTPDIERVGITARHGTYFEMLGNFSFGDYFKKEAIPWAWEFVTKVIDLPVEKLWATIYEEDDEAFDIWTKDVGLSPDRIVRLGKEDNFWEHGSGPCGPCSEIYFDRGEEFGCGKPDCKPGCDCDRYMEFWNLVFTQFNNDGHNNYSRLSKPNIDTGMGLERLACIMQNVNNLFEVDTVRNIMKAAEKKAGVVYGTDPATDVSLRVITDHIRSTVFLISDGVVPSNEGRGYVLRRLLRRAARHGRLIGIRDSFLSDIAEVVAHENYSEYPELTEKIGYIKKIISIEEERFAATIDAGLVMLSEMTESARKAGTSVLSGADAFRLYDTFGFPVDITREVAKENGMTLDEDSFNKLMSEQKSRARAARANISGWSDASKNLVKGFEKTDFVGYENDECEAKVIGIIEDDESVISVNEGTFSVITDRTVFYGEGGGQVGDTGKITSDGAEITVLNTLKTDGVFLHICRSEAGTLSVGDKVLLKIDAERRAAIRRNHTACHMLQAALRSVLGEHVEQAGSYVDDTRLRFDFTHYEALKEDELRKVENIVNGHILAAEEVRTEVMSLEDARKTGAMALFGEKYGDTVRVVSVGDFSRELCGGTHLTNSSRAGLFKIISESSVAAGVRRIEATTGLGVLRLIAENEALISDTSKELKASVISELPRRAAALQAELRNAKKEIETLNGRLAASRTESIRNGARDVGGLRVIAVELKDGTPDMPRSICDEFKASDPLSVTVIATVSGDKLTFAASCGKDAVARGAHAGNILKRLSSVVGGGGGGRPDSASSGGKNPDKLNEALGIIPDIVQEMIQ